MRVSRRRAFVFQRVVRSLWGSFNSLLGLNELNIKQAFATGTRTNTISVPLLMLARQVVKPYTTVRGCSTTYYSEWREPATWIETFCDSLVVHDIERMARIVDGTLGELVSRDPSVHACRDVQAQCSFLKRLEMAASDAPILVKHLDQGKYFSVEKVMDLINRRTEDRPRSSLIECSGPWFKMAARLCEIDVGLLNAVLDTSHHAYILSDEYRNGMQKLRTVISSALDKVPMAYERAEQDARKYIAKGRPPKDYLRDARFLVVPDCSWIPRLSTRAKDEGFDIKGDFDAPDVATAVRKRMAFAANSEGGSLVAAVRDSLLLIGEASVYVKSRQRLVDAPILPIVDARCGSQREGWLDLFIMEAFATTSFGSSVMRGGVVTGFLGYGKSELMRNVIFGKALMRWALALESEPSEDSHRTTHVGIYVKDPVGKIGDLRYASPVALIAAGLAKIGLIDASSPPGWAKPDQLEPTAMGDWLSEQSIHVALTIDEAQKVQMPAEGSEDWHYRKMVSEFWATLADMLNIEYRRPTVFLTGSYKSLAKEVYGPVHGRQVLQDDKFLVRAMPNAYSEPELHLMLLRQQSRSSIRHKQSSDVSLGPLEAPFESRKVTAADAVLALAYYLRKRDDIKIGKWWHRVGYFVQPSLDHVVRSIYPGSYTQGAQDTEGLPTGRITVESARMHLQDRRVLRAAESARERVLRAFLLNGVLARSLGAVGGTSVYFRMYVRAMMDRKSLFSRFGVALVRASLNGGNVGEQALLNLDDPFQAMPLATLSTIKDNLDEVNKEVLPPDYVASDRHEYEDKLDGLLRKWHDDQWVMYHSPEEQKFNQIRTQRGSGNVQFPNVAYARVALQVDLTRDIFLTIREQQALDDSTGDFGKDYEMAIAESLRRNFRSKVLGKGRLPSLPRDVYSSSPGVLELSWDRDSPSSPDQVLRLGYLGETGPKHKQYRQGVANRPFSAFGQIFKEFPDHFGADLAVVLRSNSHLENQVKYHVVRIYVKAASSKKDEVGASDLDKMLCQDIQADVHRRYCSLLGEEQTSGNVVIHRLLITTKPVNDPMQSLASHSETRNPLSAVGARKQRLGRYPKPISRQENMDVIYGKDLSDLLFADARLYLARRRLLLSKSEQEAREAYVVLYNVLNEVVGELSLGLASREAGRFDSTSLAEAYWEQHRFASDIS